MPRFVRVSPRAFPVAVVAAVLAVSTPLQAQVGAASAGERRPTARETDAAAVPRLVSEVARPRAFSALAASVGALRDSVVARAKESVGIRYRLGSSNPLRGLDCSALIRYIVSAFDISLPRTAQEQARMGRDIPKDREAMRPGDLLTFGKGSRITHIGMYVGEGRFIHASTSQRKVVESSLDAQSSSLVRQWKGVRRLIDGELVVARYDSVFAYLDSLGITGGDSTAAWRDRR